MLYKLAALAIIVMAAIEVAEAFFGFGGWEIDLWNVITP
jgi:hypothetical protein